MSILNILRFPDPRLRTVATAVEQVDVSIQKIIDDLFETMYASQGIGLAATQVNIHQRIIVTDCPIISMDEDECESNSQPDSAETTLSETSQNAECSPVDVPQNPLVFINPEIIHRSETSKVYQEGCLSVPEIFADVTRADAVTVRALNAQGESFNLICEGLLATCIQHEIDHLNGKLFVDYLSAAKRNLIREKMKKWEKQHRESVL